jgi:hypothetical protein
MSEIFINESEIFIYTIDRRELKKLIKKLKKYGIEGEIKIVYCG